MALEVILPILIVGLSAASICQVLTGWGFSLVAGPVLILACGHAAGLQLTVALGPAVNTTLLFARWRDVGIRDLLEILLPAAFLAPFWVWLIGGLPDDVVARIAGGTGLLAVAMIASGVRLGMLRQQRGAALSGALSSGLVVAGGVGGPPLIMHAANNGWPLAATRATLNAYFFLFGLVMFILIGPPPLNSSAYAAGAGMIGGLVASVWLTGRVSASAVMRGTLLLAGASGLMLLIFGAHT
ncbi:hypothetical protein [Nocardioides sp. B-3]|uniref:hypothetical protein n=1 Tax=Nocardioides sp. B-3 TaxID=2895565 RepID=UPI0021525F2A|nr:hypothetical protein [Nocardioides sp. B-3]UUZ59516.1 hypothetical protein LP418_27700 [Nocardioides sp. B-3]